VKEYYFYLDSTPSHSYMKYLYKYPQTEFPYAKLVEENRRRDKRQPEVELLDTSVFDEDRYFDVFVEYAIEDILAGCSRHRYASAHGPDQAGVTVTDLHLRFGSGGSRRVPSLWGDSRLGR
jgi:hypothetical protein